MITFKEFIAEGYNKRSNKNNAMDRFGWDVQDALWEVLKKVKIPKEDLSIAVHVFDSWRNHQVDTLTRLQSGETGMKKIMTRDWVMVRFTPNMEGRKVQHDAELLYRVLPKELEKTLAPFFSTVERSDKFELGTAGIDMPHLYLHWNVWNPKWPA